MTTPTHRPHRGRTAAVAVAAVVLLVVGLVLFVTAGSNRPGGSAQAIAGAPSSTPNAPGPPPPLAGAAAAGGPVSTPGHPSPGAVADGSVSTPGSDAGAPAGPAVPAPPSGTGAPPAASGVPAPGAAAPGQPGSSSGPGSTVPGNPGGTDAGGPSSGAGPGQPGSSSNAAPGDAAGNPGNAAPSGTGGGGSGVSDAARRSALAGAPVMAQNTLSLPSLGVGPTPLGPVCSEPGGSLEPPANSLGMLCTWRGSSPPAASTGETTVAGHINYNQLPNAAFAKLTQMRPGDPIYLRGATGGTQAWIVRSEFARSKSLPLDNNAFVGPDGPRSLVLLSCGGALIPGERSYADNIYVYASLA